MDAPETAAVLYVRPESGASLDVEALSTAVDVPELLTVVPGDVTSEFDAGSVACVVTDPAIEAASLAALFSTIRRIAPTLPILCAVTDLEVDVPESDADGQVVEHVPLGDGGVEQLADRIDVRTQDGQFLPAPAGDYRRLFRESPAPIVVYDSDGVLRFANDAAADLVELDDSGDLRGRPVSEFVAADSAERVRERMDRVLESRQPLESTVIELETATGGRRFVEVVGEPVTYRGEPGGQAVLNDVTERRRREQRLQSERDQFTALFEAIPQPVVHVRFEDDEPIVVNANAAFESTFGYESERLRGDSLNEYIVPPNRQREARQLDQESLREGEIDREITRATVGGVRDFRFRSVAFEPDDARREAIGTYVDVTDRNERERELQRKNDRLETFAHIVSHDLRNPLNVVTARLELARETGDDEHFEAAERAAERMETLVEDLLTLAQQGETVDETSTVELGDTVETAWATVEMGDATLVTETSLGSVEADDSRLTELFENCFRNAREHAGEDVTVWVGREDDCLYVEDDGPGIPQREREDVFEIGYTTADDGTGYGLAIVAEIVAAHGWSIGVTDGRDGGARFEIQFE